MDVGTGEPFSHLVGSWLLVAHGGNAEVIAQVIVTVAVVGGLDDFDVLIVLALELGQWNPFGAAGDFVFWDW